MLRAHGISEKGRVRITNEDCFTVDESLQLCVVADGMGGHNAGEVAARLAVSSLLESVRDHYHSARSPRQGLPGPSDVPWLFGFDPSLSEAGNCLRTAMHVANAQILEASMATNAHAGMGTTIVAALVRDGRLSVGHVGDSRLYLLENDRLRPLTLDDSWTAVAARDAGIDPLAARQHPIRNALTNVVGTHPRMVAHVTEEALKGGEVLLLSTDGVHGVLDDGWLERWLTSADDVQEMAVGLINGAMAQGSRDNCTVVVARYFPD